MQYLPFLWPVRQSGAAVKHNDTILKNLMTSHSFNSIPGFVGWLVGGSVGWWVSWLVGWLVGPADWKFTSSTFNTFLSNRTLCIRDGRGISLALMLICRSQLGLLYYESLICLSNRSLIVAAAHMYGIWYSISATILCTHYENKFTKNIRPI